jgi:hypothetical protein
MKLYKLIQTKPSLYDLVYLIESKFLFKLYLFNKRTNLEPILYESSPNLLAIERLFSFTVQIVDLSPRDMDFFL